MQMHEVGPEVDRLPVRAPQARRDSDDTVACQWLDVAAISDGDCTTARLLSGGAVMKEHPANSSGNTMQALLRRNSVGTSKADKSDFERYHRFLLERLVSNSLFVFLPLPDVWTEAEETMQIAGRDARRLFGAPAGGDYNSEGSGSGDTDSNDKAACGGAESEEARVAPESMAAAAAAAQQVPGLLVTGAKAIATALAGVGDALVRLGVALATRGVDDPYRVGGVAGGGRGAAGGSLFLEGMWAASGGASGTGGLFWDDMAFAESCSGDLGTRLHRLPAANFSSFDRAEWHSPRLKPGELMIEIQSTASESAASVLSASLASSGLFLAESPIGSHRFRSVSIGSKDSNFQLQTETVDSFRALQDEVWDDMELLEARRSYADVVSDGVEDFDGFVLV
ncbi:hypothetical protein HDU82_001929 [Entophlyctis luteolus]|nr:hypothetical protein HDU82_001929 [Entophlyctis luteolus]